ncbi:hypothetical protein E2562_034641 [Oryza meyeriana var. granulata]|uniref:Uncharacterized protein n=1 Tax=Oryza meyeriana var. granulata TaxID=110450 RepID=A0A6G1F1F0_9ORYZ|nr:hypothetical protein E2562_034641 [Oryza meyeriana var. granulata]
MLSSPPEGRGCRLQPMVAHRQNRLHGSAPAPSSAPSLDDSAAPRGLLPEAGPLQVHTGPLSAKLHLARQRL